MRSYQGSRSGLQDGGPGMAALVVLTLITAGAALFAWTRGDAPAPESAAAIALLAAVPLVFPDMRQAITVRMRAFAPTLAALAIAFALAAAIAAGRGSFGAIAPRLTEAAALLLAGLGLAAFASARPWRRINAALLVAAILTAIACAAASLAGGVERPLLAMSGDAAATFYGLVAVQAFMTIADETLRRARGGEHLSSLSQRTIAPTLALIVAAIMIVLSGSRIAIVAVLAACAVCAGLWTMRERKPTVGVYRILAALLGMAAIGLSIAWAQPVRQAATKAVSVWSQAVDAYGPIGAGVIAVALLIGLWQIAAAADRGRRPGRGACLMIPVCVCLGLVGLVSPAVGVFAVCLWATLLAGLAAGLADEHKAAPKAVAPSPVAA